MEDKILNNYDLCREIILESIIDKFECEKIKLLKNSKEKDNSTK